MKAKNRDWLKTAKVLGIVGLSLLLLCLLFSLFLEGRLEFSRQEKKFTLAVEKYYMHYPQRLPEKDGESTKVSLQDLYNINQIDELFVPKSNKLCSASNSWVRVIKAGEEKYEYYTYLECGKYHSNIDSVGPEIELEGDTPLYVKVGSTYQDPGVKKVFDKVDGEIDKATVKVDASNVDTKKIGEYVVKYTVYDKLRNRTDVTRTVYVTRSLLDEVTASTGGSKIYQGKDAKNYVLFSGMLWRIVKVNEDNTLKLVLDDNAASLTYGKEDETFENSNIAAWLTEEFYPTLKRQENFVKTDVTWCQNTLGNAKEKKATCDSQSKAMPVGLLTSAEFFDSLDRNGTTYFNIQLSSWLMDQAPDQKSYIVYGYHNDKVIPYYRNSLVGVKPVIHLKTDQTYVISGDGSGISPYKLNDYDYGRDTDLLNTRYIGEYVNYSGQYFRIIGFGENNTTKLISAGSILDSSTSTPLVTTYANQDAIKKFDPNQEGNLGYQLNQETIQYINDSLLTEHEFEIPIYETGKHYNEFTKEKSKAKISLPKSYDLFSGANNNEQFATVNYWLLDSLTTENHALMLNTKNGVVFDISLEDFRYNANKIIISMKSTTKLSGGKGTILNPYYVK